MTAASAREPSVTNAKHPGVYLAEVNGWLYLRWVDPVSKRWRKLRTGTKVRTEAKRKAVLKSRQLRAERDELLERQLRGEPVVRHLIADAATRYYRGLEKAPKRSKHTLRNVGNPLSRFLRWCAELAPGAPLRYLDQLEPLSLASYYDWLGEQKRRDGADYLVSTVNQELKPLRRMLRLAAAQAPHLHSDMLRAAIPHTATSKKSAKNIYGLSTQRPLDAPDVARVLRAALEYDARPYAESWCAADIMLTLLTGLRIDELTQLHVSDVSFDAREHATLTVMGKGSEERDVHMRGFSVLGVELVHALVDGRRPHEWLSESSNKQLSGAYRALPSYGAPGRWVTKRVLKDGVQVEQRSLVGAASSHDVRATYLTYAACALREVDLTRATARAGNTPGVALESYVRPPRGMVYGADTLEQAMDAERVMRDVIAAARARQQPRELERRNGQSADAPGVSVPAALR